MAEYMLAVVCLVVGILAAWAGLRVRELGEMLERERQRSEDTRRIAMDEVGDAARSWIMWYLDRPWWDRWMIRSLLRRTRPAVPWHTINRWTWRGRRHG